MDMQGDPIGGNNASTKVCRLLTTTPRGTTDTISQVSSGSQSQKPIQEGAGPIASDSLAAESARSGGGFNENRDSNPQSVSGSNSTFANTDTSGAKTLAPARDAASRDNVWNESGAGEKYPEGAGGQGQFSGSHAGGTYSGGSSAAKRDFKEGTQGEGYDTSGSGGAFSNSGAGGPSADKISSGSGSNQESGKSTGENKTSSYGSGSDDVQESGRSTEETKQSSYGSGGDDSNEGSGSSRDVDAAPGYVSSVTQPLNEGKPKGAAVEGSEEDFKGPSNQDAEIGGKDDPGLQAEQTFQASTQSAAGGSGPRQGQVSGDSPYDNLKGSEQA